MNEQVIKFIKKCVWVAISAFVIRCSISHVELIGGVSLYSLWGYAGEAIGFTTVIMLFYEKHLWTKRFMNEMADRKTRADAEYVILREAPIPAKAPWLSLRNMI